RNNGSSSHFKIPRPSRRSLPTGSGRHLPAGDRAADARCVPSREWRRPPDGDRGFDGGNPTRIELEPDRVEQQGALVGPVAIEGVADDRPTRVSEVRTKLMTTTPV